MALSQGLLTYNVYGRAVANKYNVSPLLGLALPRGVPHVVPVSITNPHAEVLVVKEVFTTEDFLSLRGPRLPGGKRDPAVLPVEHEWEIAPGETRELLSLSIVSMDAGSYSGYVHIKTDKDNLVIPVSATVSAGGISSSPSKVDFGDMFSADDEVLHEIWVFNSGYRDIVITDMYHKADPGLSLSVNTHAEERVSARGDSQEQEQEQTGSGSSSNKVAYKTHIVIPAGTGTMVATLLYSSSSPGRYKGKIFVLASHPSSTNVDGSSSSKTTTRLEIPYKASGDDPMSTQPS